MIQWLAIEQVLNLSPSPIALPSVNIEITEPNRIPSVSRILVI